MVRAGVPSPQIIFLSPQSRDEEKSDEKSGDNPLPSDQEDCYITHAFRDDKTQRVRAVIETAIFLVDTVEMNDWSDAERRVERAQQFFEQRKWSDALREIRAAIEINPYNPTWFFNMGLILDEMGRFDEALEAYSRAHEIDPNDLHTLYHTGRNLFRAGQLDRSIETFQQIQAIDATFEPSYCHR